jgi:hypothetical protein
MQENAFVNQLHAPSDDELTAALGSTRVLWDRLIVELATEHGVDSREWKSYSPKYGWSLRLIRKKRNILYLSPCSGAFRAMLIFGDRAMQAVAGAKWPRKVIKIIEEAPHYPEGTGIRIDVTRPADVEIVKKLSVIKLQH